MTRLKIVLFLLVLALFGFRSDHKVKQEFRFDGKYGLFVQKIDNDWQINWQTSISEEGVLRILENGNPRMDQKTPASTIHQVMIPATEGTLDIQFGGVTSELYDLNINQNLLQDPDEYKNVDSIFVLGDTHGNFDEVIQILRNSTIINQDLKWTAGNAHFVFVGDILDRGKDALRLAWFIYELEQDAAKKGGVVHMVLGNHEIMVMSNDMRYVAKKEQQIADKYGVEYRELFDPKRTLIGQWLATKPAILTIDKVIFTHGGLIINSNPGEFNQKVAEYMQDPGFTHLMDESPDFTQFSEEHWTKMRGYLYASFNPFWYRGYVQSDTTEAYLDYILEKNRANLHVVGHTIVPKIQEMHQGKLIATNVEKGGTEMLFLVKKKKKFKRFRIELDGSKEEL